VTPGPGRPVVARRHGAPLPTRPHLAPRPEHLWIAALAAAVALAAMRVAGLHGPRAWAPLLPLGFVLMAGLPWWWLTAEGRRRIGLQRARSLRSAVAALAVGAALALACGALGQALFGAGPDHWYQSVAAYYRRQADTQGLDRLGLYLMFTLPALIFSPIGEEVFFRGVLHGALAARWGERWATWAEASLFGVVHLAHHGVALTPGGWALRPASAALWVLAMMAVAHVLAALRRSSGSLGPPILAHASFNAAMNAWIFLVLWP